MLPALPVTRITRPSIHWRMSSMSSSHRLALQQVFDGDRPRLDDDAAFDQLPVVGHHADLAGAAAGVVHELAELRPGKLPLHDQDLPHADAARRVARVFAAAEHRHALDAGSHQVRRCGR